MKPTLKVTADFTKTFNETVAKFKNDAVLIGIPEDETERGNDPDNTENQPINNATILAINHFGSEDGKIPPRPALFIGLKNAQDQLAEEMKKAAQAALKQGFGAVDQYYNRAGIIGSNAVKKAINAQDGIDPPAEATLKAREARGFKGTKALIVTGQMRNSITYVIAPMSLGRAAMKGYKEGQG
jgi:hypothetical protein